MANKKIQAALIISLLSCCSPIEAQIVPDLVVAPTDPDIYRNVSGIIESRGFICREYDLTTQDGYIITIHRIINPLVQPEFNSKMRPIILQHGLQASSSDFVIDSARVRPEKWPKSVLTRHFKLTNQTDFGQLPIDTQEKPNSLAFYLANRGFDVWLANSRGNLYGQKHVNLSLDDSRFWSFSMDEMIAYDLPATIEFVLNRTNKRKVGFVGNSQGTTLMFGLLAEKTHYSDAIEPFVALAPVVYLDHVNPAAKALTNILQPFYPMNLGTIFGLQKQDRLFISQILCGPKLFEDILCAQSLYLMEGFSLLGHNSDKFKSFLAHSHSITSLNNILHMVQILRTGQFGHFDHGKSDNLRLYNSEEPPKYDLGKIRSKSIVLFTAPNDIYGNPNDIAHLIWELNVKPFAVFDMGLFDSSWGHKDFLHSKYVGELVNTRIEQVLKHFTDSS